MTREYARVKVSIWADGEFRLLSSEAQALYFRLLSSPTMSLCGVADWRPNRMAALTAGMTADMVRTAAAELAVKGYVVADEDTEEILVRSFIRHDGLIKTPNIAASMAKDYAGTSSPILRGVIIHELHRMYVEDPGMKGWSMASKLLSDPAINPSLIPSVMPSKSSGNPSVMPSKSSGNPSVMPSGNGSPPNPSGMAYPIPSGNGSHIPHPSALIQHPSSLSQERAALRAQRRALPDGWRPDPDVAAGIKSEYPNLDLTAEHEIFADYWRGTGKPMKDWEAVWRNWMRRSAKEQARNPARSANRSQQQLEANTAAWDAWAAEEELIDQRKAVEP